MHLLSEMVHQPRKSQDAPAPAPPRADTYRSETLCLPDVRLEIRPVLCPRSTQQAPTNKSGRQTNNLSAP